MLELTLRSTVILIGAWLVARTLSRATAATRHLVWHTAFIAIVAAPLIAPIAPQFRVPGLSALVQRAQEIRPAAITAAPAAPLAQARHAEQPKTTTSGSQGTFGTLGTFGTVATLLWFATGWAVAALRVRRAAPAPAEWQLEVNALGDKWGMAREVRLKIMAGSGSPLASGVWRAAILLPPSAAAWSADERHTVLLHELAHIRRGDCRVQLLTHVACALYWFNPFVWAAASQLRSERERASDDEVLRSGARATTYAAHLLAIARDLRPMAHPTAALTMARASDLEGRLLAILADRARAPRSSTRWAVTFVLAAITVTALGASSTITTGAAMRAGTGTSRGFSVARDVVRPDDAVAASKSRSIGPLQHALADGDQDVREKAALALAFMSGREVVPALLAALRDRDSQVREKAAIGLALRRDERIIEPLLAAMRDPDSQVREKVAIALGTSGDPRARGALNEALEDSDAQVREKAAAGLVLLGFTQ